MIQGKALALILGAVLFSVIGQLFLKAGAQHLAQLGGRAFLLGASRDARVLTGLVAWVTSTIFWLYALRLAPLSRAYGLTSLTYVFVLVGGVYYFQERVRPVHFVGTVLIFAGIACLLYEG